MRFPAGWSRGPSGYYEAAEDVVFLDGALEMSGVTYAAGDWGYVPRGAVRHASVARAETLALARFSEPAKWVRSEVAASDARARRHTLEPDGDGIASPLGTGRAWLLRAGSPDSAWLAEPPDAGRPAPVSVELLDLDARIWAWVPAGTALPAMHGLCFCRTFS